MRLGRVGAAKRRLHALRRDGRGVVALESALVGIPMVVLIAGTIYAGLNMTALTALDTATRNAARNIRIADVKDTTDANTRQTICSYVGTFTDCTSNSLFINVQNGASFAALPPPLVTFGPNSSSFNPGASGNYVLMRVGMKSNLALNIAGMDGPVFSSVIVFRNE